jgi:hypothetical protein
MSDNGIAVDVISVDVDSSGHGTLNVRFPDMASFKATIVRLSPATVKFGADWRAQHIALAESDPTPPASFPGEAAIAVTVTEPGDDEVQERMSFGNNYLGATHWVEVIRFDPPTEAGAPGVIRAQCDTAQNYTELRRFVDEPHGSILRSPRGNWWVHRTDDDGQADEAFPQKVNVQVEWRAAE